MYFLIKYDRSHGRLEAITPFSADARAAADAARLDLELATNGAALQCEIVLLEAASLDALRLTHRRYFEDLPEFAPHASTAP